MIPEYLMQRQTFRTRVAREAGVSDFELSEAVRQGVVTRLKRGWYTGRPILWPSDRHRLLVSVELSERGQVVASHHSGAVWAGLPVHRPDWGTVHLMRTRDGPPQCRPGLVVHGRVRVPESLNVALVVAQTALACPVSGLMAIDAALARGLATIGQVEACARLLGHRKGQARLATVLRLADARRESPLESRTALVCDGLEYPIEAQFAVPGTPYRVDGRIPGTRVLIESDGLDKYDDKQALVAEKLREDALRAEGWEVVRVTDRLLDRPEIVLARIRAALHRASTPHSSSG